MTEEEAKSKRCCGPNGCGTLTDPAHKTIGTVIELGGGVNAPRWCNASACAGWKWKMTPKDAAMLNKIGKEQEPQGYCGLTRGE